MTNKRRIGGSKKRAAEDEANTTDEAGDEAEDDMSPKNPIKTKNPWTTLTLALTPRTQAPRIQVATQRMAAMHDHGLWCPKIAELINWMASEHLCPSTCAGRTPTYTPHPYPTPLPYTPTLHPTPLLYTPHPYSTPPPYIPTLPPPHPTPHPDRRATCNPATPATL